MRRFLSVLLVIVGALALLVSSTSLWLRHNVINTSVFVSNVERIVDAPAVQARINDQVTSVVMSRPRVQQAITQGTDLLPPALQRFRPSIETGVRSIVSAGVRTMLTAQPFRPLTRAALASAQTQLVDGQPVRFTVGQAKRFVPPAAQSGLAGQVLALIPSDLGITVLTPSDAPQLYTAVDLLKSAWWWTGLLGIAAFAGAVLAAHRRRAAVIGFAATTAGLVAVLLITLRIVPSFLLPRVQDANRAVVSAVYDGVSANLIGWTLWLGAGALVLLAGALLWGHVGLIPAIRRGGAAARAKARAAAEARAEARAAAGPEAAPVERESWWRRSWTEVRTFFEQLDLAERFAAMGGFVRAHLAAVRGTGIAVAAVVLLLWPSPTLRVLIWIAALLALYLVIVELLRSRTAASRAEEAARAEAGTEAVAVEPAAAAPPAGPTTPSSAPPASAAVPSAPPVEPVAEPVAAATPAPTPGPAAPPPAATAPAPAGGDGRGNGHGAPQPEPVVPSGISHEALATLNERLDLLVRLEDAKKAGVLTEEEFSEEKEALLRR